MQKLLTRKQIRLKNYDYSDNGCYFLNICSNDRKNIFGEYKNNEIVGEGLASSRDMSSRNNIQLSIIGQIIDNQWKDIKNQYIDVELDQYIIMPNHLHGIIIINKREDARPSLATIILP